MTIDPKLIWQFLRFAAIGTMNAAINFLVLNLLAHIFHVTKGESIIWIAIVAFVVATTNSYFFNKYWTFKDRTHDRGEELVLFLLVSLVGAGINSGIVYLITTYTHPLFGLSGTLWLNVAALAATAISLIWNFIGYRLFVFKSRV